MAGREFGTTEPRHRFDKIWEESKFFEKNPTNNTGYYIIRRIFCVWNLPEQKTWFFVREEFFQVLKTWFFVREEFFQVLKTKFFVREEFLYVLIKI